VSFPPRTVIGVLVFSVALGLAKSEEGTRCQKRILVNVLNHNGEFMSGLEPSVFRAQLHGQPLKVLTSTPTSAPPRIVILVDLSGSTHGVSKIARALAENIVVSSHQRPALVLFSDHVIETVDFSHSPEEVVRKLDKLPESKGPTALYDGLKYAADLFGEPLLGDSVYLIFDGGENASKVRRTEVQSEFLAKGIRIYTFCLQIRVFPTEEEEGGPALLKELSDLTGGEALNPKLDFSRSGQDRLASELQRLYQKMTEFYELQLDIPGELLRKRQRWDLEVLDRNGRKRKDLRVVYPHELNPCSESLGTASVR